MAIEKHIIAYITAQPESKRQDLQTLHQLILKVKPGCKLWFLDGKNEQGKIVSHPNIGYGAYTINYADGSKREFYKVGLSAHTTGISVYIMGLEDKLYLAKAFGATIGKAKITGYCIRFKALKDIHLPVLMSAIQFGFTHK